MMDLRSILQSKRSGRPFLRKVQRSPHQGGQECQRRITPGTAAYYATQEMARQARIQEQK